MKKENTSYAKFNFNPVLIFSIKIVDVYNTQYTFINASKSLSFNQTHGVLCALLMFIVSNIFFFSLKYVFDVVVVVISRFRV